MSKPPFFSLLRTSILAKAEDLHTYFLSIWPYVQREDNTIHRLNHYPVYKHFQK